MKNKFLLIPVAALMLTVSSCKEDMDYHEYAIVDKDFVELNFSNVGGFMTQLYKHVEYDFGNFSNGAMQASATDESEYSIGGNAIEDFYNGGWSAANPKPAIWNNMYAGIAEANRFLEDFQGLKFEELELNPDYQKQMFRYENYKYEARFLRAYYYFTLVRTYGGVPLIKQTMPADETNKLSRNTSDEVYDYIFSELNEIKDLIIVDYSKLGDMALGESETGRAGKIAVLALRARAALYWASPLFNPNNDTERYKIAADYHKELLDECKEQGKKIINKYSDLWAADNFSKPTIAPELLFCYRYYSSASGDNLVETNNYPVGIDGGRGGNCPTQNLVDAYETKNGLSIKDPNNSQYDPNDPYKNRDPRLGMSIAVNGEAWPTYQTNKLQTFYGGLNAQPTSGGTTTSYYLKKLCNGTINLSASSTKKVAFHTYLNFRMGGAYLDYAECLFKATGSPTAVLAGHEMSANDAVFMVRNRNGVKMPKFPETLSNDEWWTKYCNERFVELCFEGHRFWDVRRWKEGSKYFTSITRTIINQDSEGNLTYFQQIVPREWDEKMNLFPIPQTERAKNPNLEQNPGW